MPRITKDCFGTVISSLRKMKECTRCEVLAECRSINWQGGADEEAVPSVRRAPAKGAGEGSGEVPSGEPSGAGSPV